MGKQTQGQITSGLVFSFASLPARAAAGLDGGASLQELQLAQPPACQPPEDWDLTVRLNRINSTMQWTFEVAEPEMGVILEFILFQDYDSSGCPLDCSVPGECQLFETGVGESPLGTVEVTDGVLGPNSEVIQLEGTLPQGSYPVTFTFTGRGSMNVGLRATTFSLASATPTPTSTATATFTPTATPTGTATPTPTFTPTGTPTFTPTGTLTVTPGPLTYGYYITVYFNNETP